MEENTLQIKIKKQLEFIKQEVARFKRAFQGKQLKTQDFTPYLQALNKVFDLNNQYGEDYYEFIDKKNLHFVLKNNRELMKDVTSKFKGFSIQFQQSKIQTKQKLKKNDGVCNICQKLIDSQNIQEAKNSVQDIGFNKLKQMLKMIQQEGNKAMFTPEEDMHFFQQLHRVLTKKQQLLSITDNHLQKYLDAIMKNMEQIKNLEDLKDTSFSLPQQIDWQTKIKNQINFVLLGSFKGKVPTWIQKMFDYFIKLHSKFTRQFKESKGCQTEPYVQEEMLELRNKIEEFKEQQKANKAINQDYLKVIQDKEQKIEQLQIQMKIIKENFSNQEMGRINKRLSRLNDLKQVKQQKSYRNSQRKSEISQKQTGKSKSQHKFKKISKISSSLMSGSLNKSSLMHNINNDKDESQSIAEKINDSKRKSSRNEYLVTEHLPELQSNDFGQKLNRKKLKKLTDIQHFKKTMSSSKHKGFLPNIEKLIKDSKVQQNFNGIKKTSILTNYYQPVHRPSQKNQMLQRLEFSALRENTDQQKYIKEIDQDMVKCITQSEINLSKNFTDSQRNMRLKTYKQKVSDVQNQLQNKVHKIQALKKTYQMKKLNTSASFTAKVSPLYNQFSPLHKMNGQRFASSIMSSLNLKKPEMKDFTTQTQNQQMQKDFFVQLKTLAYYKKSPKNIKFRVQKQNQGQKMTKDVEQTQKSTKQSILKKFVDNGNLLKISEDHLEKILSKLLLVDSIKNQEKRSTVKSTHREFNGKSSRFQQVNKQLSKSKVERNKSDSQKQNMNQKSQQKQGNVPKLLNATKISLKQKLVENTGSRDISPTTKQKKIDNKNQVQQSLPNISGINTKNKKNQDSCLFTKKDFSLFINQENSFKYESNMSKKYHKIPSIELTQKQIQNLTSVYGLTQIIKSHSPQIFSQIISFIKYPYHSVVNNFSILNITKDMSLETWLWHFSQIKSYHKKCIDNNDENQQICGHIENFISKIEDTLADVVKQQISNEIPQDFLTKI